MHRPHARVLGGVSLSPEIAGGITIDLREDSRIGRSAFPECHLLVWGACRSLATESSGQSGGDLAVRWTGRVGPSLTDRFHGDGIGESEEDLLVAQFQHDARSFGVHQLRLDGSAHPRRRDCKRHHHVVTTKV